MSRWRGEALDVRGYIYRLFQAMDSHGHECNPHLEFRGITPSMDVLFKGYEEKGARLARARIRTSVSKGYVASTKVRAVA